MSSATVAINTCGFVGVSDARLAFDLNAASKVDSFDRCLFFVEGVGGNQPILARSPLETSERDSGCNR